MMIIWAEHLGTEGQRGICDLCSVISREIKSENVFCFFILAASFFLFSNIFIVLIQNDWVCLNYLKSTLTEKLCFGEWCMCRVCLFSSSPAEGGKFLCAHLKLQIGFCHITTRHSLKAFTSLMDLIKQFSSGAHHHVRIISTHNDG